MKTILAIVGSPRRLGNCEIMAKEISRLAKDEQYEAFEARRGVMAGEPLSAEKVAEVSTWPSRGEQLSLLVAQILGPGATLAAQLVGPAGTLVGQVAQPGEEDAGD